MRKVLRFFEIVIVGLLLTAFVVTKSVSNMVLDKTTVKKTLDEAGIYEKISNEIRKSLHEELDQVFSKYPNMGVDLDDIIDNTLSEDVLRKETDFVLDSIYDYDEKIELDPKIMAEDYRKNLDKYLKEKNITLPQEINAEINKLLDTTELEKIDISDYTSDFKVYMNDYKTVIDLVHVGIYIILITALLIMGFAVIISKEKLKVIYKPLIFAGVLLLIIRVCGNRAFDILDFEANNEALSGFIDAARKVLFTGITKYIVCFLGIGLGLMGYKIVTDKKDK